MLFIRLLSESVRLATWRCDHCGAQVEYKMRGQEPAAPPVGWPLVFIGSLTDPRAVVCSIRCAEDFAGVHSVPVFGAVEDSG